MPTRKIADLPANQHPCMNPEHNPPMYWVPEPGVYEHECPGCGKKQVFTVGARWGAVDVMTHAQLQILQHSLGVDEYGRGNQYRNFFCAGGKDEDTCRELVALGFMKQHKTTEMYPYFNCSVTEEGKAAMLRESPEPPKLTRSQQRYRDYLKADTGFSFREYLETLKYRSAECTGGGRLEDCL